MLRGPPIILSSGYLHLFPMDVKLTTHLPVMPRLRMRGAILPLPCTFSSRGAQLSIGTTLRFLHVIKTSFVRIRSEVLMIVAMITGVCVEM
jgi:hypothetical protein